MDASELCLHCCAPLDAAGPHGACAACGRRQADREPQLAGALPPGSWLSGRYRLGQPLGRGGLSIAYLAWDAQLCRRRAVKEYFPRGLAARARGAVQLCPLEGEEQVYAEGIARYLAEARLLARLEGKPGVIYPLDFFEDNATAYLVLEHLEGETLHAYVERHGGQIPYAHALYFMLPLLRALRAVHGAGVLHRDVSPDNVFLTVRGETKLLDFGAARPAQPTSTAGPLIVRDRFAAPEQYSTSGEQGPWTDVYGFAATFYYAITGYAPPSALDRLQLDSLRAPRARGAAVPRAAQAALLRALALRAEKRPTSEELLELLERAAADAVRRARQRRTRRTARRLLGALGLLALLGLPAPSAPAFANAAWSRWLFGQPVSPTAASFSNAELPHDHSTARGSGAVRRSRAAARARPNGTAAQRSTAIHRGAER